MAGEIIQANSLEVPAYLSKYTQEKEQRNDFGALKPQDFGVSFIKVCQGQSRESKVGPNGEPALGIGTLFTSRDRQTIPIGTPFIPLCRSINYIRWIGKPGDGKMDFATTNENDERIKKINGLAFLKDPRTGETASPLVTQYQNFYVMVKGIDEPLLISFHRTAIPNGRKLTQELFRLTKANKLPMYAIMLKFDPCTIKTAGSNQWLQLQFSFAGYTPENLIPKAEKMYELAIALREASTGAEMQEIDESSNEPDEATLTQVHSIPSAPVAQTALPAPATITATPQPQQTPPAPLPVCTPTPAAPAPKTTALW